MPHKHSHQAVVDYDISVQALGESSTEWAWGWVGARGSAALPVLSVCTALVFPVSHSIQNYHVKHLQSRISALEALAPHPPYEISLPASWPRICIRRCLEVQRMTLVIIYKISPLLVQKSGQERKRESHMARLGIGALWGAAAVESVPLIYPVAESILSSSIAMAL